jgi:hypothetical protein
MLVILRDIVLVGRSMYAMINRADGVKLPSTATLASD